MFTLTGVLIRYLQDLRRIAGRCGETIKGSTTLDAHGQKKLASRAMDWPRTCNGDKVFS